MKIIGFNLEKTTYGLPLDNGGACLIVDGEVKMVINEERLNRKQYSAGFELSINYILQNNNLSLKNIDLFVASSCLDVVASVSDVQKQLKEAGFSIPKSKIKVCTSHHLAHAYSAFYPSPFEKSIIMVLDGDGNVLSKKIKPGTNNNKKYWFNKTEHNSYYIGDKNDVVLLEREDVDVKENGFGGAYRYFTYFCGFPGYKFAGKLMGLSAYGAKRNKYKDIKIFDLLPNGQVKCLLPDSDRLNSAQVVEKWLKQQGVNVKARDPKNPKISKDIEDIAFLVQRELDKALVHKVNYMIEKTGIKNLCIAGGVGLNAVTNRTILDNTKIKNIFIQPAAGDSGQCLGNAYYGLFNFDKKNLNRKQISVYQGKEYSDKEILNALQYEEEPIKYTKMKFDDIARLAAKKAVEGNVVGWFQGRSEMGPRALGNRSIIANPAIKGIKDIINSKVKHREVFRPFAPSVLEEDASKWFDIKIKAPYMIMNAQVLDPEKIPSITHKDGSARIQTVNKKDNSKYHKLISEFKKITGIPVVINTSLNDNEAIVESPRDVVNLFLRTGIDYLFVGDYFVEKDPGLISREKSMKVIENKWSKIASQTKKIQNAKSKVMDKKLLSLIKKHTETGDRVFDYNTEWGEYANLLSKNGFEVYGLNASDRMIMEARKKFKRPTFFTQEEFYKKVHTLENKFDAVLSNLWLCITKKEEHNLFLKNSYYCN